MASWTLLSWLRPFARRVKPLAFGCPLLVTIFLLVPSSAWAWGCQGHQLVALIAEKHLTPHARSMAEQILRDGPIDPNLKRFCKDAPADALADASTWADDFRTAHPETGPWHFVDIPRGPSKYDIAKVCAEQKGCITQAIRDQLAVLQSPAATSQEKGDALRYVIHFVGDLHQPLHATTDNDMGGNCVPLTFVGDAPQLRNPDTEAYAPNLHGVWDFGILERMTEGQTMLQAAEELDQSFAPQASQWLRSRPQIEQWARESHHLADTAVYGELPMPVPLEAPQPVKTCADDNHVAARRLKLNEQLGAPYQAAAAAVVRQQIAKAGVRLASLLNQLWP